LADAYRPCGWPAHPNVLGWIGLTVLGTQFTVADRAAWPLAAWWWPPTAGIGWSS
jgi:hypothetical protein